MVAAAPRVLVVDDEPNIVDLLRMALRFHGFDVLTAATGRAALELAVQARPDLMILDVMLPDVDGFEVCRTLRAGGQSVPVVYLTARDAHRDKIAGLTYGGDDYVTKPFAVDELVARVRAVLRRTSPPRPEPAPDPPAILRFADVELDPDTHVVRRAGEPIELSPTEFTLLRYFLTNPNRVLSRAQILDAVWSYDFAGEPTVVDQYVSYLRRKLGRHGPSLIHTQRGFGYALRLPAAGTDR
ncbi:response regulator with CheY-like receiver domain and winged-helix DNA-binding domain [Frankia torreyi]|uniref:Response regulator with CheY-like receiver domain and winged-helix DNA-binding domain n=2 Tax=Frankia TaxID=1854 RepID=A0A0D8BCN8_9ACTN|nr:MULTISPECIES: response regulator transcription factor [Frankia]KJE21951.1 response regulator with CheY-like receiver domain and winged-helix DNA-binding domain [Frankia torreyi]KQC37038.1 alkaline phosphatase [Frankia sp. ACN1ag]